MAVKQNLVELTQAVTEYDKRRVREVVEKALREGIEPLKIVDSGLVKGIKSVRDGFAKGEVFLPELMMAAEAMKAGMELLKPEMLKQKLEWKRLGKVVIGTVKGDIHDIGKNIVALMLDTAGFEVIDLGVNVEANGFLETVRTEGADILGMSALLTTTMIQQKIVLEVLKKANLRNRVKVMIGGAAVTPAWAKEIGADGYGDNAITAVQVAKNLLRIGRENK